VCSYHLISGVAEQGQMHAGWPKRGIGGQVWYKYGRESSLDWVGTGVFGHAFHR
jgi:hypothetical protein